MQVALLHPGTQHSRQTALALQELRRLAFYATGLFDHPGSKARAFADYLPGKLRDLFKVELSRFAFPGLDPAKVRAMPQYELPERIARRMGAGGLADALDARLNHAFGRRVAGMAGREGPLVLWGYDSASAVTFTDPRVRDFPKILDRTMADCRTWNLEREWIAQTHGDWLGKGSKGWSRTRIASDDVEFEAADVILCGSPFAMRTIAEHSPASGLADKLELLPYPFDRSLFTGCDVPQPVPPGEPVRFLFVGQVSARKGVQHLLEAIRRLPATEAKLTVVGTIAVPDDVLAPYRDRVEFTGPVLRTSVPDIMRRHHAFVFPSHYEGSAQVLPEAMASGLAVIQTAAAGLGASGKSGFVLDRPSAAGVEQAMQALVRDRELLHTMRLAALAESASRDFAAYRAGIADLLDRRGI